MRIPSSTSAAAVSMTEVEKSREAKPAQNATNFKPESAPDTIAARTTRAASSTTIKLPGLSSPLKSQVSASDANPLNSMLLTSLKMNSIRNDPILPEQAKQKLLKPLVQANKNALAVADAKAEQEKKSKIIEASDKDAEAIRKAGEEIAASAETKDTPTVASADSTSPASTDEVAGATKAVAADAAPQATAVTPTYSATPPTSAAGKNVDTHA